MATSDVLRGPAGPRMSTEWLIGLGALLVILGIVALVAPVATSIGLAWLMGALFLASGLAQAVHAIRTIHNPGKFTRFLLSALAIVAGIVTMRNPAAGMLAITMVLGFYLLASSVAKWFLATDLAPFQGRIWMMVSSGISFLLGILLIISSPATSLIVPGVFFGVDLIFYGAGLIGLSFTMQRVLKSSRTGIEDRTRAA